MAMAMGVDLAPQLHAGIRRLADGGDRRALAPAIGLLEVLACHHGGGRQALELPSVEFGEAALERLTERLDRGVEVDEDGSTRWWNSARRWIDPALEHGPDEALRRALRGDDDAPAGTFQAMALVERTQTLDGTSGGSLTEVALASLRVDADGWSYERRPLWTEEIPGIELS